MQAETALLATFPAIHLAEDGRKTRRKMRRKTEAENKAESSCLRLDGQRVSQIFGVNDADFLWSSKTQSAPMA
jgi:hypothetical protein